MTNFKILIKFPTRNRPKRFFETLDIYINKANNLECISFLITCDNDDMTMNDTTIHNLLNEYQKKYNLQYFFKNNTSKIEAINSCMEEVSDWDILLLASDDMIPIVEEYDNIIRYDMEVYYPNLDGILWYNDRYQNRTNTLSILGKTYYKRFNYIYHPSYKSLYCDNEYTEVALSLNKCYKSSQTIIEHIHPVYNRQNYDDLYIKNESYMDVDRINFEQRKKNNFL